MMETIISAIAEWWGSIWTGSPVSVAGQVLGLVIALWQIIMFFPKKRDTILRLKRVSDAASALQFLMVGGVTGAILNSVMIGRETVFLLRDKKEWARKRFWLFVFLGAVLISPSVSLISGKEGWYAVLPAIGSSLAVIAYYQLNAMTVRILGSLSTVPWLVYAIFAHNVGSVISSSIAVVSGFVAIVTHLVRGHLEKKKATAEAVRSNVDGAETAEDAEK